MEVCGRYHHWMPALVRVVHPDVFVGWCLVHLRAAEDRALAEARALRGLRAAAVWRLGEALAEGVATVPTAPYALVCALS
jgi:heme/copper-type cytochrome/quinol oxidase subunit 2